MLLALSGSEQGTVGAWVAVWYEDRPSTAHGFCAHNGYAAALPRIQPTSAVVNRVMPSTWPSDQVPARTAQSNPQTLSTGAPLRTLYAIVTAVRRPLNPGASFGAVCPPALMTPT